MSSIIQDASDAAFSRGVSAARIADVKADLDRARLAREGY
jgi:hypothetical protein